jgi:hypothetical protein
MRLDSSGNLGLGVTPSAWVEGVGLNVGSGRGGSIFTETVNFGFTTFNANAFYSSTSTWKYVTSNAASRYQQLNGVHSWYTASSGTAGNAISFTQAMTLDASGKFMVGTTSSPNQQAAIYRTSATTSNGALLLDGDGSYAGVQFASSGTLRGSIGVDPSAMYFTHGGDLIFKTGATNNVGGTERARITSGGNLLVGTTTNNASGGVIQVSNGITFPATQSASSDANTLDDYEEGTWTPNQGSGLTVVGAFSSSAVYTKIGNLVYVRGYVQGATSISIAAGGVLTSNLPFSNGFDACGGNCTNYNVNQTSGVYIQNGTSANATSAITGSQQIIFGFTYRV